MRKIPRERIFDLHRGEELTIFSTLAGKALMNLVQACGRQ
jgi:hypothetical protein